MALSIRCTFALFALLVCNCASDPHTNPAAPPAESGEPGWPAALHALETGQYATALQNLDQARTEATSNSLKPGARDAHSVNTALQHRGFTLQTKELDALDSAFMADAGSDASFTLENLRVRNLKEIQQGFPVDLSAAVYFVIENRYVVFVVTRDRIVYVRLDAPAGRVNQLIRLARAGLRRPSAPGSAEMIALQRRLADLHAILFQPIEQFFVGRRLIVAPASELQTIPLQALIQREHSQNARYLIEDYEIAYAISLNQLNAALENFNARLFRMIVFGDPVNGRFSRYFEALPAARAEAQLIQGVLPEARVLVGPEASERNFKKLTGAFAAVHLATHGMVTTENPASSFLLLADGDGEDGVLTLKEILQMELRTDLITLSACETAAPVGSAPDNNAAASLALAFLRSGARTVIASLWPVSDASTARLMTSFYTRYGESDKSTVLRAAQLDLLQDSDTAHPFYWSAFALYGSYK